LHLVYTPRGGKPDSAAEEGERGCRTVTKHGTADVIVWTAFELMHFYDVT